ncbi:MAG: glycerol-3-phosphate O-acyltransferase [Myxococcota bacterium]|jgi:glycerol-3-phosphate O-acyltransferase
MAEQQEPVELQEPKPDDTNDERSFRHDPYTTMVESFNLVVRWLARRYFRHFQLDPDSVEKLREMEAKGAVVYVMRYSSRLDYFLLNTLFAREGLRLSSFANGIRFHYFGNLIRALRMSLGRARSPSVKEQRESDRDYARCLSLGGQSQFLFLRTQRLKSFLQGRKGASRSDELDLLQEVVQAVWDTDRPVFVVPVTLFWRKGPRTESRFLNLSYGTLFRPSDIAKVSSFLANYRSLSVKVGNAVDLQTFIATHRTEGPARVARKIRRSILIYLFREEKVVEGPTLRSRYRVQREVLDDPGVREAMAQRARDRSWPVERAQVEAEKIFSEIAASMNSTFLALMNSLMTWLFRKLFSSIEIYGLDKVADNVKQRPVVLVPSHRSYFDFLILSVLLYGNFMVPPHIAARDNMAFGPFGFLFRKSGAFFMRGSFDDPLYKEIFRSYLAYLVREGFTQEFFIEGGRSRTGKTLAPRLGMLTWEVDAFIDSHQRDFVFIPVAINYERLVEESSILGELSGEEKTKESMLNLVKARKYLQRRFGSAHVSFGDAISLADVLADRREAFRAAAPDDEAIEAEKRALITGLGWRIVEEINWSFVANATSVAASALMGVSNRGIRRTELAERIRDSVDLLKLQKTKITKALIADQGSFDESISFLLRNDLIKSRPDPKGEILYFEESRRQALDLYRNSVAHFLAVPSFLARRLLAGAAGDDLRRDLPLWQELYYQEFYSSAGAGSAAHCEEFLSHFVARGWMIEQNGKWAPTNAGRPVFENLAEQTRSVVNIYELACDVAGELDEVVTRKEFYARIGSAFEGAALLGEATRSEAANDTTYSNATDLLLARGVLTEQRRDRVDKKGKPRGQDRVLEAVGSEVPLAGLREALAVSGPLRRRPGN